MCRKMHSFIIYLCILLISSCSDTRNYDPVALEIVQVETPIGISTKTDSNWILYWHESSRYSKSSY